MSRFTISCESVLFLIKNTLKWCVKANSAQSRIQILAQVCCLTKHDHILSTFKSLCCVRVILSYLHLHISRHHWVKRFSQSRFSDIVAFHPKLPNAYIMRYGTSFSHQLTIFVSGAQFVSTCFRAYEILDTLKLFKISRNSVSSE